MIYKIKNSKALFFLFLLIFISCSKKDKKVDPKIETTFEKVVNLDSTVLQKEISLKHPSAYDSILIYTVQIGAFKNRNSLIEKISEVHLIDEGDSLVKYRFGNFKTYQEANTFKQSVQQLYPDAFIVPVNKGFRIDISKALELSNEVISN